MTKQVFETSWRCDHSIECLEAWCKIAKKTLGLFVQNVEKDRSMGCIFGNKFRCMLMLRYIQRPQSSMFRVSLGTGSTGGCWSGGGWSQVAQSGGDLSGGSTLEWRHNWSQDSIHWLTSSHGNIQSGVQRGMPRDEIWNTGWEWEILIL